LEHKANVEQTFVRTLCLSRSLASRGSSIAERQYSLFQARKSLVSLFKIAGRKYPFFEAKGKPSFIGHSIAARKSPLFEAKEKSCFIVCSIAARRYPFFEVKKSLFHCVFNCRT
jgi:hypothetical protein